MSLSKSNHILVRQKLIDAAEGRLITVTHEFENAFAILEKFEKTVTVFGSARLRTETDAYQSAYRVGAALAKAGYAVVTGGGFGVMEAANKGAIEAGGASVGFNIELPTEQKLNDYTTDHYSFEHFFGRKVTMTLQANAYIFCEGGFGTLDELFEIVTLAQTGKIPRVPIILFGGKFWEPMMSYITGNLLQNETISAEDKGLFAICDEASEIVDIVNSRSADVEKPPRGTKAKPLENTKL